MQQPESNPCAAVRKPRLAIGILAWNEQSAIVPTLRSLLRQSVFTDLAARGETCQIVCVANGCTDQTVPVASSFLESELPRHPCASVICGEVQDVKERGKANAWNQFVHRFSAESAEYLVMMDADIDIHLPDTLRNMMRCLEADPEADVAVDQPVKHLELRSRRGLGDRLSIAAGQTTRAAEGQLCGQLYLIRAAVARKIYMPRELSACEDGFIKTLVCTDFLTRPSQPRRIRVAENSGHVFEAYTSARAVLRNQKRQAIGQTLIHILADRYLKSFPEDERRDLAATIQRLDAARPGWLKSLVRDHLGRVRRFWRLYPGVGTHRLRQLKRLGAVRGAAHLPAGLLASAATLAGAFLAFRSLKRGCTDYWPKAERSGLDPGLGAGLTAQPPPAGPCSNTSCQTTSVLNPQHS